MLRPQSLIDELSVGPGLYVIRFSNDITKVGRSGKLRVRVRSHVTEAARWGIETVAVATRTLESEESTKQAEIRLVQWCRDHGTQPGRSEYFRDLDYDKAVQYMHSIDEATFKSSSSGPMTSATEVSFKESITVVEASSRLSVSEPRVRELIRRGSLPGSYSGGRWYVSESAVQAMMMSRRSIRPLGDSMAALVIGMLSGEKPHLVGVPKARLSAHRAKLLADPNPSSLLAAWMRGRGEVIRLFASRRDLDTLRRDPLLVLSGESDERAEISAFGSIEAHIERRDLNALTNEYGLSPSARPNLILHVSDVPLPQQLPLGIVIADLCVRFDPRRETMANRLIREALA